MDDLSNQPPKPVSLADIESKANNKIQSQASIGAFK